MSPHFLGVVLAGSWQVMIQDASTFTYPLAMHLSTLAEPLSSCPYYDGTYDEPSPQRNEPRTEASGDLHKSQRNATLPTYLGSGDRSSDRLYGRISTQP